MKNTLLILTILFSTIFVSAQENRKDDWIRVQSDNGEFSIEVPANYSYFYDKDGFSVFNDIAEYKLKEMSMINAYIDDTLISFEFYKGSKEALNTILALEAKQENKKFSDSFTTEIKKENYPIMQRIIKNSVSHTIRQYFYSPNYIYILTVSSKKGETDSSKRFLDSLKFSPHGKMDKISNSISLSALRVSTIEFDQNIPLTTSTKNTFDHLNKEKPNLLKPSTPTVTEPLILIHSPQPSYTNEARKRNETGILRMKLTFSESGSISKVVLIKSLNYGLVEQAFFAAIRLKFLPKIENGKPVNVTKTVEYSFTIY